jgi:hypothetical protein
MPDEVESAHAAVLPAKSATGNPARRTVFGAI